MMKALILIGSLSLSLSAANACNFMRSAQTSSVDKTVVASVSNTSDALMSTPVEQSTQPKSVAPTKAPTLPLAE